MAFNPGTDVVLEVLQAADPGRAAAATQRLASLGAGRVAAPADFASALQAAAPARTAVLEGAADARRRLQGVGGVAPDKAKEAKTEFEAMLLSPMIGQMLPKDAGAAYGHGMAGDMWRSMLAEQVARQIARSGALGLSAKLFATHDPLTRSAGFHDIGAGARRAVAPAPAATQTSANPLSLPGGAPVADGAFLFNRRNSA